MIHPNPNQEQGYLRAVGTSLVVKYPMNGEASIASVTACAAEAAWGTAVLTIKWCNDPGGPFFTFAAGETAGGVTTIGPGDGSISWINMQGKGYLIVQVTTAEGADEKLIVTVCDDQP